MKIHHISGASLCPMSERLSAGSGRWLSRGRMVCHCWLVEGPRGLILVDTGLGLDDLNDVAGRLGGWFERVCAPVCDPRTTARWQIEELGFRAEDVRDIIVTHLDLDHAGGIPDFPHARVHVHRAELEAARERRTHKDRRRYRPEQFERATFEVHEEAGEAWFGFDGVRPLGGVDDVLMVPLTGHSRGHCGVAVRGDEGWMLHAGDAYFFHGEMAEPPSCPPGLRLFQRVAALDNELRHRNQARLRELVREHGAEVTVCSAHCPVELDRLAARAAGDGADSPQSAVPG